MPINVNRNFPGGLEGINAMIGSYASPEAAQSDLSNLLPQGNEDYVANQYQRQTGDYFANPYADAAKRRDQALMSTIDAGKGIGPGGTPIGSVSVAAGSNLGPRILGIGANSPLQQGPTNAGGVATMQPLPSAFASGAGQTPDTFGTAMANNPLATDLSNQRRRVNETGDLGTQLYSHFQQNNPTALTPLSQENQQLQLNDKGVPVAGNVLNKNLFNDPKFQIQLKTNPTQAHKFYQAVTGRNLQQDIEMQAAHEGAVNKSDQESIDKLRGGLDFDETGNPFVREMVSDPFNPGEKKEMKRPLSYLERQTLNKPGALKNITGQDAPPGMDYAKLGVGNLTPQEQKTFGDNFSKTNPSDPMPKRIAQAKQMSGATSAQTPDQINDPRPWWLKTTDTTGKLGAQVINSGPIDLMNQLATGANNLAYGIPRILGADLPRAAQIPHIPVPTEQQSIDRYKKSGSLDIGDIASQGVEYWKRKFPQLNRF